MHESSVVRELMTRVEEEVAGDEDRIQRLTFRVGALSGIGPEHLREGACRYAMERWGYEPIVEVEQSGDATDPNALGVLLVSIGLEA